MPEHDEYPYGVRTVPTLHGPVDPLTNRAPEPMPEWFDDALYWHTREWLAVLEEVHGPHGSAPWGGSPFIAEMCRHLIEEPNEDAFKLAIGWRDTPLRSASGSSR